MQVASLLKFAFNYGENDVVEETFNDNKTSVWVEATPPLPLWYQVSKHTFLSRDMYNVHVC